MAKFYHIYINPKQGVTTEQIEKKLDLAIDWFRYDSKNWVVFTSSDEDKWFERLKSFVQNGGQLFLCAFDISTRHGWMSKEFWDWITKNRNRM
ncbi:MAG: hypothetical protein JRN15_22235 [Nitrososphaerota archaeon]|nr:hypothetical protein [Nitrososphaerota archaeon]